MKSLVDIIPPDDWFLVMMNYRMPQLGKSDELFDFLKPKAKGTSVYDVFSAPGPGAPRKSGDFLDFFKPTQKRTEEPSLPSSGGDPFAAARGKTVRPRSGGAWAPYPRMREGYAAPALSGPGCHSCTMSSVLENPALWLITGTVVLIALEANGVTRLSSNA